MRDAKDVSGIRSTKVQSLEQSLTCSGSACATRFVNASGSAPAQEVSDKNSMLFGQQSIHV